MSLRSAVAVVWRRRWFVLLAGLVAAAVALAVSLVQAPSHAATATLLLAEKVPGPSLLDTPVSDSSNVDRWMMTQVQLIKQRPNAEAVIGRLSLTESPEDLMERTRVSSVGQTNLAEISVTGSDPKEAAAVANAFAAAYLESSRTVRRETVQTSADRIERQIQRIDNELAKTKSTAKAELDSQSAAAREERDALLLKLSSLRVTEQLELEYGRVVSPAVAPKTQPAINYTPALMGFVLGLCGGAAVVLFMDGSERS